MNEMFIRQVASFPLRKKKKEEPALQTRARIIEIANWNNERTRASLIDFYVARFLMARPGSKSTSLESKDAFENAPCLISESVARN